MTLINADNKYVVFKVNGTHTDQGPQYCNGTGNVTYLNLTVTDFDNDGYGQIDDCNDSNAAVNPGATETCNSIDDNCNGVIDEGDVCLVSYYCDADGDAHASKVVSDTCNTYNCVPSGCSATAGDDCCDAGTETSIGCAVAVRASIHPGVEELCGGIDYNCDGITNGCGNPNPPSGPSGGGGGGGSSAYCGDGTVQTYRGEQCEKNADCSAGFVCNSSCKCAVCQEDWTCGEWGSCSSQGVQTRTCSDANACGTVNDKPSESQACTSGGSSGSQITPLTEISCGNGVCDSGETCESCPEDCDCGQAGTSQAGGLDGLTGFIFAGQGLPLLGLIALIVIIFLTLLATRRKKKK